MGEGAEVAGEREYVSSLKVTEKGGKLIRERGEERAVEVEGSEGMTGRRDGKAEERERRSGEGTVGNS